jgi:signal transduction histidine kinase
MDLSPDGRWLASLIVGKGLVLWDLLTGTTPGFFEMPGARSLCFHALRPEIYVTSQRGVEVRGLAFETATPGSIPRLTNLPALALPRAFDAQWIAPSGDGRTMALGSFYEGRTFVTNLASPGAVVWLTNLAHLTQGEVQSPGATLGGGGTLALSRDGRWAACGFLEPPGTKVWDARSGEQLATLSTDRAVVQFSPDDRWIAAVGRASCQLFRSGEWKPVWTAPREGALFNAGACAFSPAGDQLALAKSPQTIAILDATTGTELTQLVAPTPSTIKVLRWSSDGARLVAGTGENLIQVWELNPLHKELASLGLDWGVKSPQFAGPRISLPSRNSENGLVAALVPGLFAAGLVTLVTLLALRRHRRLIQDFADAEALVDQRERELHIERDVGRLKSSFVSMVSHEFRTPLGVITSSTGNLQRYAARLSEEQRSQLTEDILRASSRMRDLIDEVLLLAKVEAGKMNCKPEPVDLRALCQRSISEVTAGDAGSAPIEFACEFKDQARVDETLAGIILTNLLNNAVKYSKSSIRLSVRREAREIVLEVRDRGIGIPTLDQADLFRSFHRGSNVGNVPGTGLGLTIVKRCVELHGGRISFVSVEGQGTTFTVRLPELN